MFVRHWLLLPHIFLLNPDLCCSFLIYLQMNETLRNLLPELYVMYIDFGGQWMALYSLYIEGLTVYKHACILC